MRFAAAALVAVLAIGCSSDDGNSNTATDDSTTTSQADEGSDGTAAQSPKEKFVAYANNVCGNISEKGLEVGKEADEKFPDPAQATEKAQYIVDNLLPMMESQYARLKEMKAPQGDEQMWADGLVVFEANFQKFKAEGPSALFTAQKYPPGTAYGLDECFPA